MKYCAFEQEGKVLRIDTAFPPNTWANQLFNRQIYATVSQRMEGAVRVIGENFAMRPFMEADNRFFVCVDDQAFRMCAEEGESFSCRHSLYDTRLDERFNGVKTALHVFAPTEGSFLIWTAEFENTADTEKNIEFFSQYHFSIDKLMSFSSRFDTEINGMYCTGFPYHVKYEDYERLQPTVDYKYVMTDAPVTAYEGNAQRFYGCDDYSRMPRGVLERRLLNKCCELEPCYAIFQHSFTLAPGEKKTIRYLMGLSKTYEQMLQSKAILAQTDSLCEQMRKDWDACAQTFQMHTLDHEWDALVNYWLKKQIRGFVYTNRGSTYCCVRNQLQDLMGYSLIRPRESFDYLLKILRRQKHDGFLKQHYDTTDAPLRDLGLMFHSDSYLWLLLCACEIIENCEDRTLYQYQVEYLDSPVRESVLTHLQKAAYYMFTQVGEHGLCLFLDGDWTDPVNGPGRFGKGESTWNSLGLCWAVDRLNAIFPDDTLAKKSKEMKEAVNRYCWDGEWYLAGFSDDGTPIGSHRDEACKIFLNTQTWAIMAGAASGERLEKVRASVEHMLRTDYGYAVLAPAFTKYNPFWGKISVKLAGTTENGSVYNHAVMFKAYADVVSGDPDAARNTILMTLPTNFDTCPDEDFGCPLFFSNYYFGLRGDNYGRVNAMSYRTGTVAWCLWITVKQLFGIQRSGAGVQFCPQLPKAWNEASMHCQWEDHSCEVQAQAHTICCIADGTVQRTMER